MFGRLKSLFQSKPQITDPYEQFVVAFIEECKRQGRRPDSYDPTGRFFVFDEGTPGRRIVYLDNGFKAWLQLDKPARAAHLSKFIASSLDGPGIEDGSALVELMPGVRSRALISNLMIQSPGGIDARDEIAWAPFCGELVVVINHDRPGTLRPLTRGEFELGSFSFDTALKQAMTNLRSRPVAPAFEPHETVGGLFVCENLTDFQSSLLLLTPGVDFQFPTLHGAPVVLVPARNQFFVTGSENLAGLEVLLGIADAAHQQPHFLSSILVVWRDGRWVPFKLAPGGALAAQQRLIELRDLALDYRQQKALLDQLHKEQNRDVVVSEYDAYQPEPGAEFSLTFLASGSKDTLLPMAEQISIIRQTLDARTGLATGPNEDAARVTWADAIDIAGDLLEHVPGLYPERYRVRSFPDTEAWKRLKERALP